mgnify:CR=1 FL=1
MGSKKRRNLLKVSKVPENTIKYVPGLYNIEVPSGILSKIRNASTTSEVDELIRQSRSFQKVHPATTRKWEKAEAAKRKELDTTDLIGM